MSRIKGEKNEKAKKCNKQVKEKQSSAPAQAAA